jgi:hypothetical protein
LEKITRVIQSGNEAESILGAGFMTLGGFNAILPEGLVPQGKSKKIKGKRKKDDFISFLAILNGSFISAELY